ncbi:thermonuclease family protein [Bordetella genomosp. 4]|nr:thermonuclease family protein [Bordetella genomosp. 4]
MRRQFSFGGMGRKLGSVLGIAIAALVVHWFQGGQDSPPVATPASQSASGQQAQPSSGSAGAQRAPTPATTRPANSGASAVPAGRYTLRGVVSKVADGDTVTLTVNGKSHRVRLDSIDAPEAGHSAQEPGQPYAEAAQRYLDKLVGGKALTAQCYRQDQFDRDVCALMLPDGNSANRVMVASGYAWAYTARRGDYLNDAAMPGLQRQAREAGLGLWAQGGPTEPWKWRYECWRNQRCDAP